MAEGIAEPSEREIVIGPRLRAARQAMGWSMEQVAAFVGVTKGFISRLERDDVSPSLQTLVRLCRVLRITIDEILEEPEGQLVRWPETHVVSQNGITQRELTPRGESHVSVAHVRAEPGSGRLDDTPYTIDCDTVVLHVLTGRVRVLFSAESITLDAGDTYTFDGREPHNLENADAASAAEVIVVMAPAPASRRRRRPRPTDDAHP